MSLNIKGHNFSFELGKWSSFSQKDFKKYSAWIAWEQAPTKRHELYYALWEQIRPLPYKDQEKLMNELVNWSGKPKKGRKSNFPLTQSELEKLNNSDLIDIGAHTNTHPALPLFSKAYQLQDIEKGKVDLEEKVGKQLINFAYPYGDYNLETVSMVRQAGFKVACTTAEKPVNKFNDNMMLPRFQVKNWDGDQFEKQLLSWLKYNN